MIVLDTNVISALMRPSLNPQVVAWLDQQEAGAIWTSAITVYELEMGLALLTAGKRRRVLTEALRRFMGEILDNRVADLNGAAATYAGQLSARERTAGRQLEVRDALIAGIVHAHSASLATRNVRHFANADITILDPWATGA